MENGNNIKNLISHLPDENYESSIRPEIFPTICGVCLSESKNLLPMKEISFVHNLTESKIKTEVDFLSVLKQFYSIQLSDLELKPQNICDRCVDLASKAFNFLQLFHYSSKVIDQKLESSTIKQDQQQPCSLSECETLPIESKTIPALSNDTDANKDVICDKVIFEDDKETIVKIKTEDVENISEEKPREKPVKKKTRLKIPKPNVKPIMTKKFAYENNMFLCGLCCDKSFDSLNGMLEHVKEEHDSFEHCVICRSILKSPEKRRYHYATHSAKSIVCRLCRLVFESVEELESHKLTIEHSDKKMCTICQKKLSSRAGMLSHMKEVHFGGRKFQCAQCGAIFSRNEYLTRHEKRHEGTDGLFLCPHCGKVLSDNFLLKMHIHRKHNIDMGMEPIIKSRIAKQRRDAPKRIAKQKKEAAKKPFRCETCGKGFGYRGVLRSHVLSVHGTKPWECHICKKKFLYSSVAAAHLRTHAGIKPFLCPYCDKKFRDTISRHKHVKSTHPELMEQFKIYKEQHQKEEVRKAEEMN